MAGEPHLLDIELTTAGVPHARYAALRRSTPVCWQEAPGAGGYWAILKHADVQHVSRTPRLFSAEAKGMQLHAWKHIPVQLRPRARSAA